MIIKVQKDIVNNIINDIRNKNTVDLVDINKTYNIDKKYICEQILYEYIIYVCTNTSTRIIT